MLLDTNTLYILMAALFLDALIGDPDRLWRKIPHPVVIFGILITFGDSWLNRGQTSNAARRILGFLFITALTALSFWIGLIIVDALGDTLFGNAMIAAIAAVFLAQRSLYEHVHAVYKALRKGGIEEGRKAVSMIVGRDPSRLDKAGVVRASVESCAENFSDGVVAPAFWFAIFGLPGLLAYKAINTADSMIGYRNDKYRYFGWASARIDDLVNLIPARLSGIFIALAAPMTGGSTGQSLKVMLTDAGKHRSPNAGWPEAAMAGALNIALAGPRVYATYRVEDPWLNEGASKTPGITDIFRAQKILIGACAMQAGLLFVLIVLTF
ncbi:MAG: adenosylcobinamide-phosphate synthase CbiB [Stappiaceae bacterium]